MFVCPCHGARFERNGRYINGPADGDVDRFVVRVYDADKRVVATTDADGVLRDAPRDGTIVVDQAVGFGWRGRRDAGQRGAVAAVTAVATVTR